MQTIQEKTIEVVEDIISLVVKEYGQKGIGGWFPYYDEFVGILSWHKGENVEVVATPLWEEDDFSVVDWVEFSWYDEEEEIRVWRAPMLFTGRPKIDAEEYVSVVKKELDI